MFKDRSDAGHRLGKRLLRYKDRKPVILALPRGGVPVACEIARILDAPLDVLPVRVIGAPARPEAAIAAVVDGTPPLLVEIEPSGAPAEAATEGFEREVAHQIAEVQRRRKLYLGERPHAEVKGRVAVLVDDGITTGTAILAAARALRRRSPQRLVLAVPVAPPEALDRLSYEVDEVVCLLAPPQMEPIAHYYGDYHQVHDNQVIALLQKV